MLADGTRIIPDYRECGWFHHEEDVDRTLRDDTRDYHPIYWWPQFQIYSWASAAYAQNPVTGYEEVPGPSSPVPSVTDDTAAVRHFLADAWIVRSEEDPMTI